MVREKINSQLSEGPFFFCSFPLTSAKHKDGFEMIIERHKKRHANIPKTLVINISCVYGIPEPACESGGQARNIYLYNDWKERRGDRQRGWGKKGIVYLFSSSQRSKQE